MIAVTMDGVTCISLSRDTVLEGGSGKYTPDESSMELEENFRDKAF